MADGGLVLLMVGLHFVALGAAALLIAVALRGDESPPHSGDDGSGGVRRPEPPSPRGGPPLANARPARLRLRGPGRLADAHRRRRGRDREPRTPVPAPAPRKP